MILDEYQCEAAKTDLTKSQGAEGLHFLLLGLFGEVGTLLSALKKQYRDPNAREGYSGIVEEEFGDTLWYFANIASRAGIKLSTIALHLGQSVSSFDCSIKDPHLNFAKIQGAKPRRGSLESRTFENSALRLAGNVGVFTHAFSENPRKIIKNGLDLHLIQIFEALVSAANIAGIDLGKAVEANVSKIQNRWPEKKIYGPLFDVAYSRDEQLPRKIQMHIREQKFANGKTYVIQQCNGINIGSILTDNKQVDDDYRFHDVFHLAYAAILGWSPVLRALFKVKRKSDFKVDDAEDGQRVGLVEEAVSTLVFSHALKLGDYKGINSVDYTQLKLIKELVEGYEVQSRPLWQWEKAILDGFKIFRQMRKYREGVVTADLVNHKISFKRIRRVKN